MQLQYRIFFVSLLVYSSMTWAADTASFNLDEPGKGGANTGVAAGDDKFFEYGFDEVVNPYLEKFNKSITEKFAKKGGWLTHPEVLVNIKSAVDDAFKKLLDPEKLKHFIVVAKANLKEELRMGFIWEDFYKEVLAMFPSEKAPVKPATVLVQPVVFSAKDLVAAFKSKDAKKVIEILTKNPGFLDILIDNHIVFKNI